MKQDERSSAGHVKDKLCAQVDGVAFGIYFKLLAVPVPGELTEGFYELSGS